MMDWCAQIVHVGSYYAYTLFGRVEGVPRARTEFIYAFCNDLRRKTAQCVGILIRYYVISLISHVSRAPKKKFDSDKTPDKLCRCDSASLMRGASATERHGRTTREPYAAQPSRR